MYIVPSDKKKKTHVASFEFGEKIGKEKLNKL